MNPFPQDWELLALFESEPTLTDRDVPWFYGRLSFETTRGDHHIRCDIEPGNEILELRWWRGRHEIVALDLHWVRGLRVITGGGRDCLVAMFRDPHLADLKFQLKPTVTLRWATTGDCP